MDSVVVRSVSTAARAGYTGSNCFAPWSRTVACAIGLRNADAPNSTGGAHGRVERGNANEILRE